MSLWQNINATFILVDGKIDFDEYVHLKLK